MEVHHHPQLKHEPKPWKEYLLEYAMIVMAVITGFFAESYRERLSDHSKEHEYIVSMIKDAQTDTANVHLMIKYNKLRIKSYDTLAKLCFNFDPAEENDRPLYAAYINCTARPAVLSPIETTLSQLKNAGGMRLIHVPKVADSIISYDDFAKKLLNQQVYYERFSVETGEQGLRLFNYSYYQQSGGIAPGSVIKMLSKDKTQVIQLGNEAMAASTIFESYIDLLQQYENHADNLMKTLRTEYKIQDDD